MGRRFTRLLGAAVVVFSGCIDGSAPDEGASKPEIREESAASGANLYALLLAAPLPVEELPDGFRPVAIAPGVGIDGPSEGKVGSIIVDIQGPDQFNVLRYEILTTPDVALAQFKEREANARDFGPRSRARVFKLGGFPHPSLCVDDRNIGTECLVVVDNVIVFASAANDPPMGRFLDTAKRAIVLVEAGVTHLESVRDS